MARILHSDCQACEGVSQGSQSQLWGRDQERIHADWQDDEDGFALSGSLLKYMAAFWFFNDGINTVIVMATIYGSGIGIETSDLILALLITQFVGYPSTLLFIKLASRFGAKKSLNGSLMIYVVIVILGFFMTNSTHFYLLAFMVGLVQGGSQAIARSLYANLVPPSRTAEFFGFLSLSSKFSSVAGPLVFAVVGTITGSKPAIHFITYCLLYYRNRHSRIR